MSTAMAPALSPEQLVQPMSKMSMNKPSSSPQPPAWTISPIVHVRRDVFSRIYEFDGQVEVRKLVLSTT